MKAATAHYLEELYLDHHGELLSYLSSRSKDTVLVADLIQDTFLKLYAFLDKGKKLTNPRAWLFRVGQNMLFDHYRKNGLQLQELREDVPSGEAVGSHSHGPEDCLLGIIASLPYKYKKAVYLIDVKGERQVDAAQRLNLSLPTLKSHVQRGRKLVKQGYVACCNYEIDADGHLQGEARDWSECEVCSKH